jgi:hypothetical protein
MRTTGMPTRRLAMALEPVVGQVYFSPEAHAAYVDLGFNPSPGALANGLSLPDGPAYFTSRGSVMGQVPGQVVAAAFAVFNPAVVVPAVTYGWSLTDAATICAARTEGAVAQLTRILGPEPEGLGRVTELLQHAVAPLRPEGRPLFAGLLQVNHSGSRLGEFWHLGDLLREYRGDSHTAAWISAGLDATEIGLLSELYWGLPLRSYIRTRAWSDDQLAAAEERLIGRGLITDGAFTDDGRRVREAVEVDTDRQCEPIVAALGDHLDELLGLLSPWGAAIREAGGYPPQGPQDLAPH